jgi:2-polyprenyl-3-methyl-5-hydroxy-6-metoxy-1,4-benzoquinol methylase
MRDELYGEMFLMEQSHWWFQAKHKIVRELLGRYLGKEGGSRQSAAGSEEKASALPATGNESPAARPRIADLGCGCGMMLYQLKDEYEVTGLDGSEQAVAFSAQRGIRVHKGFLPSDVPLPRGQFDAVLMLDVLEHLEHDVESARVAAELLRPGGILICTVPAYQWLWSKRDEHHQHFRRYSAAQFRRLFEQPDLELELFSHLNTWLFPVAAAARLTAKVRNAHDTTDLHVPPAPLNAALRELFASERHLLGRLPLPFGLSLAAVARKTA